MVLYIAVTNESSAPARKTPVHIYYKRYQKVHGTRGLPKIAIVTVNPIEEVGFRSLWAMTMSLGCGIWFSELSNGLLSPLKLSVECIPDGGQSNGKWEFAWEAFSSRQRKMACPSSDVSGDLYQYH